MEMAVSEFGMEDVQWWTAKRYAILVLSIPKGRETGVQEAAKRHFLTPGTFEQ
ncbi:MAG: hypothetical protein NT005_03980 [Spirochaetes bacterium]|nr:hypothetical protein [Spirochaetota bacterium]